MVHQRTISPKLTSLSKDGYQAIELTGSRYVLFIDNGTVTGCQGYNKLTQEGDFCISPRERVLVEDAVKSSSYLFDFSGALEIILNSYQLKIVDIIVDIENKTEQEIYSKRLDSLYNNIENKDLLINRSVVVNIGNNVLVPTLYRSVSAAYIYGCDFIVTPSIKESVYVIVGECNEVRDSKILVPKKDYETLTKVPKVIKNRGENDLEVINKWKDALFESEAPKVIKQDAEYVELDNPERCAVYLVGGRCPSTNDVKIFGRVKKSSKIECLDTTPIESSRVGFIEHKNKLEDIVYYQTGYVVACATPKITPKNLSHITVFNMRQNINMCNIESFVVDAIPTVQSQQMKKRLATFTNESLIKELISRLGMNADCVQLVHDLEEICNDNQICSTTNTNKRCYFVDEEDEDDEDYEIPESKRQKLNLCRYETAV
ncbi:hypothetical protein HgNV_079 [Homarus gammarus nudivirus]|uniref:Uncharacterized protein n=1 Tax=Homarus gammarus nudivirus TaxID=2509616 RepID=A0A411HBC4_9VIRU|nr:hypothetical protein KM727_gp79 [Homarus gammarus nudivirus]QBB28684.1 hypothetical protein HgNV_079 [Homarus gammarus nudivirus]